MAAEECVSEAELALIADVIAAVGTTDFYAHLLRLLDERIQCERRLVMRYSQFARPEFVFNSSLEEPAVELYLSGLYRLDPLLRLVTNGDVRPVVTFRDIRMEDHENAFYDEIFKAGLIYDELAIMLPTMGGACVVLCFDRHDNKFGAHEANWAKLLYPTLLRAHDLHIRTAMFRGLSSLFGDGRVGIITLADDGRVIYQNDTWRRVVPVADEERLIGEILGRPEHLPCEIRTFIGHWEYLGPRDATTAAYRALFLEERSAGYIDRDIKGVLEEFIAVHLLSPRESQILEKMMRGYPTGSISAQLGLSGGTVKNYKRRLYTKLNITNEREVFPLFMNHLFGSASDQSDTQIGDHQRRQLLNSVGV
jgi:DNA-binding CsgD family transcriptional regulator